MTPDEMYGLNVFNDAVMRRRLPRETYQALRRTIQSGRRLPEEVAGVIANAMKDWAIENGCTHYTHWFQPLTGVTAEKHDGFLNPTGDGSAIMEFSAKELVRGEPDASSFPSGGLRATFEARGYTGWDPTSFAFIKNNTLCIPSVFLSYSGDALDKKTPLLRSMDALNRQGLRILRLFSNRDAQRVIPTTGPEQEYFLIDKDMYQKRRDLQMTGRTLFGARPVKGQELDDHYFGSIKPRVVAFMRDLDEELWKLGIPCKTEHNETAPAQHELAHVYENSNLATDHNQLIMDLLKNTACKHGMVCLLHEKPFSGINGSGKHNNWGLCTDTGINLLEPGETPQEDAQFLLFLCAVLKAVDLHQDLLRISVATAGNDCRLGSHEAPPAIISVYLGDELTAVLDALEHQNTYVKETTASMSVGVHMLPRIPKDSSDRNRTSPFAFSGNKFEFRSLGSSNSTADPNTVLNTIVADVLCQFADELEKAGDFQLACQKLIVDTISSHKRVIFNGNSYSDEWVREASRRGLLNLPSVPDCLPYLVSEENIALYARQQVMSETELRSRYEILADNYCKVTVIEGLTMLDMARRDILPAVSRNTALLCDIIHSKSGLVEGTLPEQDTLNKLHSLLTRMYEAVDKLEAALKSAESGESIQRANKYRQQVLPAMQELRAAADAAEQLSFRDMWPMPGYSDILGSI